MTRKRPREQEDTDGAQAASPSRDGATVPERADDALDDPVEIADLESFPASDPPAWVFEPRKGTDPPQSSRKGERNEKARSATGDAPIAQGRDRNAGG
jgi:hypothetical protein